jgi:hypothetical protein
MYSLILALALVGGAPPTDKADFNIVSSRPPAIQVLSKDDFCLVPPTPKPVLPKEEPAPVQQPELQRAAPVIRYVPASAPAVQYQYIPQTFTSPYSVYGNVYSGSSCSTGNCPRPSGRLFKR